MLLIKLEICIQKYYKFNNSSCRNLALSNYLNVYEGHTFISEEERLYSEKDAHAKLFFQFNK